MIKRIIHLLCMMEDEPLPHHQWGAGDLVLCLSLGLRYSVLSLLRIMIRFSKKKPHNNWGFYHNLSFFVLLKETRELFGSCGVSEFS